MRFCGKEFSVAEMEVIRGIIGSHPDKSRYYLSKAVCQELNWRKPDGGLKDMSCRVVMLKMHRAGHIELPPAKPGHHHRGYKIGRTQCTAPQGCKKLSIGELNEFRLELVGDKDQSRLWNEYIDRYHYLGYTALPGAQLRYFIKNGDQLLGLLGFGAAAWKVAPRDQWIGWGSANRENNLHLVVNNARFLILPWIRCHNLASKSLSATAGRITSDWFSRYAYSPVLLETFVEIERFSGTSYKAANWIQVGQTRGRGKLDRYNRCDKPTKSIWMYPLCKGFREQLKASSH
jgi:Druantia protein DruA